MTPLQEQVLLALADLDAAIEARSLAQKLDLPTRKVSAALKSLHDRGCLMRTGKGDWAENPPYSYRMTRNGLDFLLEHQTPPDDPFNPIDQKWLYKLNLRLRRDHGLQMASQSRFDYPEDIDPECTTLCNALNHVPGIETFESCCGHGKHPKHPFGIWMTSASILALYPLARCTQAHTTSLTWILEVQDTDTQDMPVIFYLHSPIVTPNGRYDLPTICNQADTIALHIHDTLKLMAEMPDPPLGG